MSITTGPKAGPSKDPNETEWLAWNRTGATLTVGEFCRFDETAADAGTTAANGGPLGNLLTPSTATIGANNGHIGHRGCVVIDLMNKFDGTTPGADDTLVKVRFRGRVKVQITAGENIAVGDMLGGANAVRTMSEAATNGLKVYAIAEEAINPAVAGTLYEVDFKGDGWGNFQNAT